MKTTNNKKNIAVALLFFLFQVNAQAELLNVDSLKSVLSKNTKEDTNRVIILNRLSKTLIEDSKLDSAIKYAKLALELSKKINYKSGMGYAYNKLGLAYDNLGNSPEALANFQSALKIKEEIGETNGLAWTYYYIGSLYNTRQNYIEALKYAIKGKNLMNEVGDNEGEITCYISIGNSYTNLNKYKEALDNYFIALNKSKEIDYKKGVSLSYIDIGDVYLKQGNYKECLTNQFSALKIAEEIGDKYVETLSYINIGICNKNLNDLNKAEEFCVKGLNLAKDIYDIGLIRDAQESLSEIYTDKGDTKKAFEYYKYYIATRDSFINEANTKKTTMLEMNYQFDKKQAIAKLEQEKKDSVQKSILSSVVFGLIISVISSVIAFRNYKRKKKDNILLTQQKEELNEKNRIIEDKQKAILDSIRYAKRIQVALITPERYIEKSLNRLMK